MRAIDVDAHLSDLSPVAFEVENEIAGTLLTTDLFVDEFPIDAQFAAAVRAEHVIAAQRQLGDGFDFLKRHEFRYLDAVGLEIGIQQSSAIAAMNEAFGHYIAARGTWSAGPWWHRRLPAGVGMKRL
jgi:hypothetical protein